MGETVQIHLAQPFLYPARGVYIRHLCQVPDIMKPLPMPKILKFSEGGGDPPTLEIRTLGKNPFRTLENNQMYSNLDIVSV